MYVRLHAASPEPRPARPSPRRQTRFIAATGAPVHGGTLWDHYCYLHAFPVQSHRDKLNVTLTPPLGD